MKNEEIIVEELSKKFNKKEETIRAMIQILEKENYTVFEIKKYIMEFYRCL